MNHSDLNCEICQKSATAGVRASGFGAISYAICNDCLAQKLEPWYCIVTGLCGCEPEGLSDWVMPILEANLKFHNKTVEDLWKEVREYTDDYENALKIGGMWE